MTAELIKDMPMADYQDRKDAMSKTMLSDFADNAARFKYYHIDGNPKITTDSLRLGNAVHTLALEPELFKSGYHLLPATYYNDKGVENPWKHDARMQIVQDQMIAAGWEIEIIKGKPKFKKTARSKIILKPDEYEKAEKMAESLTRNAYAISLLKTPGYVESSIFWQNEKGKFKCRPDKLGNDGVICDLKIARSVKPDIFFADASNFKYFLSVGLTWEGYLALYEKEPDNYVFITIEEEGPHFVECFESVKPMGDLTTESYMDYGRKEVERLMEKYQACVEKNHWPQYQEKIGTMRLPAWEMKKTTGTDDVV